MAGMADGLKLPGGLALRLVRPGDDLFILEMFMAARPWLAWTSKDRDFIRFLYEEQLRITRLGCGEVYPEHLDFIIVRSGQDLGHLVVDLGYGDWRLALLEIHPLARGRGEGSLVVRGLQMAATKARKPLTLATPMMLPRVISFYTRLGFAMVAQQPPMCEMGWWPEALHQGAVDLPPMRG